MLSILSQTEVPWQTLLGPWGLTAFLLLAVVYGGRKRWWVFGWQYEEQAKRCEMYREMAFKSVTAAETSTKVAEKLTGEKLETLAKLIEEARLLNGGKE